MNQTDPRADARMDVPTQEVVQSEMVQTMATVASAGDTLVLHTKTSRLTAKCAASCWLEPQPGDRVLVAIGDDASYVLAVLERGDGPVKMRVPRDVELTLEGELSVTAKKGMSFSSGRALSFLAGRLDVRAVDAGVALERLSVVGRYLQSEIQRMRVVGETLDAVVDRVSQKSRRLFRTVTEIEQARTGQFDVRAKSCMRLHADTAMVTAERLVKVDGEQIHVG